MEQEGGWGSHHGAQMATGETQQQQVVEEASPISSRPPESSGGGLMVDEDDGDGGGRWPRQQTLALIQIRSQMDAAFRDATLKAPLWEQVSRKLAELGYKRSAKKCKEKFENVHKYYKRTKEGRAGRQDGKTYRFFSQLEALHNVTSTSSPTINVSSAASHQQQIPTTGLDVAPVSFGIPVPMSSQPPPPPPTSSVFPPGFATSNINPPSTSLGVSFSSDGSSSSSPTSEEDNRDDETEGLPSSTATGGSRKRTRESHHRGETRQMMEFFEGLMKQVMQKQEAMQQRFLEAIEKREQDRMIREEAWKRQEMARLSREHEMMAQERAVSASRDAAIVSILQKITGQTIHLPSPITLPAAPPQPPPQPQPQPPPTQFPVPPLVTTQPQQVVQPPPPPKPSLQQDKPQQLLQRQQAADSSDVIMAIPEQQVPPQPQQMEIVSMSGGMEAGLSSRWPKAEVIALINLRSGLERRYQEAGPKGPLWEEISAGMQRLGYSRSAKRCKEKWENINKYYKKVKESNKKRPEDSKTCPYFHQLDALYSKKMLATTAEASTTGFSIQSRPEDQRQPESQPLNQVPAPNAVQEMQASESQAKNDGTDTSMGTEGATKKPEDIVKELLEEQGQLTVDDIGSEEDEEEEEEEDDGDESESQEERKMAYKIEFERQNSDGRRNGATPSFLAMVQ